MTMGREMKKSEQPDCLVINELPRFIKDVKTDAELHPSEYNGQIKRPKKKEFDLSNRKSIFDGRPKQVLKQLKE